MKVQLTLTVHYAFSNEPKMNIRTLPLSSKKGLDAKRPFFPSKIAFCDIGTIRPGRIVDPATG